MKEIEFEQRIAEVNDLIRKSRRNKKPFITMHRYDVQELVALAKELFKSNRELRRALGGIYIRAGNALPIEEIPE